MSWSEATHAAEDSQEVGRGQDPRVGHPHRDDRPIADVLEQEIPVDEVEENPGLDDDRVEPVEPVDGYEAEPAEPGTGEAWGKWSA